MDEVFAQGVCHARIGLLVLRDCGKPAVAGCQQCGRAVCARHQMMGEGGVLCPDCAALQLKDSEEYRRAERWDDPMWVRSTTYHDYGYTPLYWGDSEPFTEMEYGVFDSKSPTEAPSSGPEEEEEGDWGEGDDLDDSMES